MKRVLIALAMTALLAVLVIASEVKLDGVKCFVGGESVSSSVSADYKDGKVYFCCPGCQKKFMADTAKYATKANHQLVATGQAKQTNCPLSGEPIAQDKMVEVQGAKVYFCCDHCKNKMVGAAPDEQLNLVFSEAAWEKGGFKVAN